MGNELVDPMSLIEMIHDSEQYSLAEIGGLS